MKKTLEIKKTIELIKQNILEKKNNKNTIPEATPFCNTLLITTKEKQPIKEEPIQRRGKFGARPETKITGTPPCRFCNSPNGSQLHKCPTLESNCNN